MTRVMTEVTTTAIQVSDQDDALAFYVNTLGPALCCGAGVAGSMR